MLAYCNSTTMVTTLLHQSEKDIEYIADCLLTIHVHYSQPMRIKNKIYNYKYCKCIVKWSFNLSTYACSFNIGDMHIIIQYI